MMHTLTHDELAALARELRREYARVERTLTPGATSDVQHDLLQALERIHDGSYGVCAGCADRIPFERLEVMPATRYCVRCTR
ncbi:MAG: RNA polymerase-binding transcription factor DksA [Gemmatimonadaceae bacterium]|nr:RNA polymerase-binding transcription factor DksA [Gemmatimonadaceae bacterium]